MRGSSWRFWRLRGHLWGSSLMACLALLMLWGCKPKDQLPSQFFSEDDYDGAIKLAFAGGSQASEDKRQLLVSGPSASDDLFFCPGKTSSADCKVTSDGVVRTHFLKETSGKPIFLADSSVELEDGETFAVVAMDGTGKRLDEVVYTLRDKKALEAEKSKGQSGKPAFCESLPSWQCDEGDEACSKLVVFREDQDKGWFIDNRIPLGASRADKKAFLEDAKPNYGFSYLRRDFQLLLQYAIMGTYCKAYDWPGNLGPLGVSDLSDPSGKTPPGRHPSNSHDGGMNADIAYYQTGGRKVNAETPVCKSVDQKHCTSAPEWLDVDRTALFVAMIQEYPYVDVVAMDAEIGPLVVEKIGEFCSNGTWKGRVCTQHGVRVWWDKSPVEDRGWYNNHHTHMHIRISPQLAKKQGYFAPFYTIDSERTNIPPTGASLVGKAVRSWVPLNTPKGVGCSVPSSGKTKK